jgi:magnesium transporter
MEAVINCAAYCDGLRVANVELDEVHETLKQSGRFVWVGLHEPDGEMLKKIQVEFGLHDLSIEDAHRAHQRPKIETYGDTLFIVLRTIQMKDGRIDLGETHFFLGKNFIVTVRHGSSIGYMEVRSRCESTPVFLRKGPGFALYAVMDSIVDQYFPVVDALEQELASLEEKIFHEKFRKETTAKIYRMKRQLLEVKRVVSPLIDICNRLMRFDLNLIDDETRPYFRDVYDHAIRINEMVDNTRELLATAMESNLSMISISQSEISKRFAGWAAIIGIPTMVAGVYGMNFKSMPELEWKFGYPLILTLTLGLCAILFFRFKRSGWL